MDGNNDDEDVKTASFVLARRESSLSSTAECPAILLFDDDDAVASGLPPRDVRDEAGTNARDEDESRARHRRIAHVIVRDIMMTGGNFAPERERFNL
jgi:hypothetical protein